MSRAQSHLLRRGRYSELGRLYLLTTVTHQRKPLFHDFHHARLVIGLGADAGPSALADRVERYDVGHLDAQVQIQVQSGFASGGG